MKGAWLCIGYFVTMILGILIMVGSFAHATNLYQTVGQVFSFLAGLIFLFLGFICLSNLLLAKPNEQFDWHE